jgi:hypothetical protein
MLDDEKYYDRERAQCLLANDHEDLIQLDSLIPFFFFLAFFLAFFFNDFLHPFLHLLYPGRHMYLACFT